MRHLFSLLLLSISLGLWAETYTIEFNCSETGNDGTQATTDIVKLVKSSTYDFVIGIDASATNNVYVGKNGYGLKGGTGTVGGKITLVLDTTYTINSITLYAAAANKADTATSKGISVCGQEIKWRAPRLELQPYTLKIGKALSSLTIQALSEKNCRFYIEHIELDIKDTYANRPKVQLPAPTYKFPSMEYDPEAPAEDAESFEVLASGITQQGLNLSMKKGNVFSVYPSVLPYEGGEFTISYSTTASPSYYSIEDTCIIRGVGLNGAEITKKMAVSTMIYEPKPYVVDSSSMTISVAPTSDYYESIEGLRDSLLKSTLALIINKGPRYKYGSGKYHTWAAFFYTDRREEDNLVLDMYSTNLRYFNPARPTASVSEFDIEHMLPKSWWGGTVNNAYCDLYHLVPGDYSANRSKSNRAPGIPTDTTFYNGSFATGFCSHGSVFCPADEYKGDFARAYFYIACCYGDELKWVNSGSAAEAMTNASWQEFQPWLRDLLLEWHRMDPVSEKETKRAVEVNKIQGNRNPFIDYPELAEYIWGNKRGEALHLSSLECSFDEGGTTSLKLTRNPSSFAIKRLENGQLVIVSGEQTYSIIGTRMR